MAYNQALAQRIREYLAARPDIAEKRMFGGLAFMWQGNMLCGVDARHLMVRVGPEQYAEALAHPHASEMDLTGRPMKGWVLVSAPGIESDEAFEQWLQMAITFVSTLPPK